MLADQVRARLETVEGLAGAVDGALHLAELVGKQALPQRPLSAFVIPAGLNGGGAESSENAFLQAVDETVAVVLVLRSANDATGARAMPGLDALVWSVILALAGWAPSGVDDAAGIDPTGVFELKRGRTLSLSAGTVIYQLDFAIGQQLRVLQ